MRISFMPNSCIIICRKLRCVRPDFIALLKYLFSRKNRCQWVKIFERSPYNANNSETFATQWVSACTTYIVAQSFVAVLLSLACAGLTEWHCICVVRLCVRRAKENDNKGREVHCDEKRTRWKWEKRKTKGRKCKQNYFFLCHVAWEWGVTFLTFRAYVSHFKNGRRTQAWNCRMH